MSGTTDKKPAVSSFFVTPVVRGSFLDLFSPRMPQKPKPGDRARYQAVGLVLPPEQMDETDQKRWAALQAAIMKCGMESALGPEKFKLLLKDRKIKIPIRSDVESSGYPADFKFFLRAWTYNQPGIVSIFKGADGKPVEVKDPNKVYSGVWLRMSVKPFYSNYENQNPSIGLQLANVQIVRDDDRLDGRVAARDEFDATEDMPAGMDIGAAGGGGDAAELAALLGGSA